MKDAPESGPMVVFTRYTPHLAVGVGDCRVAEGRPLAMQPVTALCRCGQARNKPFCDGSHDEAPFET